MTKSELLEYATENDIGGVSLRQKKSEMIETIEAAL